MKTAQEIFDEMMTNFENAYKIKSKSEQMIAFLHTIDIIEEALMQSYEEGYNQGYDVCKDHKQFLNDLFKN